MTTLMPLADSIWTAARPLRAGGMAIGSRMSVVRLSDRRLWVHSPVACDDDLVRALDELGGARPADCASAERCGFACAIAAPFALEWSARSTGRSSAPPSPTAT